MQYYTGKKSYFNKVGKIVFEGKDSDNPLAFKYYDSGRIVAGKTMEEHFRFAVAYWHSLKGAGSDMFGSASFQRPWSEGKNEMEIAENTLDAAFEFFSKLGVKHYCFHDRDIAPEGNNFSESCDNLWKIADKAKQLQEITGITSLWGTANLFSNPLFMNGAASNPDADVFAYAAAQVKNAMDITMYLGGENYVFWGGREGYDTLLNTDYKHEQEQLARFFQMAVDYKKKTGFNGTLLIEPKPKEPTKHQYDFDSATILNFLREFGLIDEFKLNIEANHATLAGHTFQHELTVASAAGKLGSIDANTGDPLLGWDTDQFLTNIYDAVKVMMVVLNQGGLGTGGFNFDAKLRRTSVDPEDLFYAHIGSMDTFARGLLIADEIRKDGKFDELLKSRYSSYDVGTGLKIMSAEVGFEELDALVKSSDRPVKRSGKQEYLENLLNRYVSMI